MTCEYPVLTKSARLGGTGTFLVEWWNWKTLGAWSLRWMAERRESKLSQSPVSEIQSTAKGNASSNLASTFTLIAWCLGTLVTPKAHSYQRDHKNGRVRNVRGESHACSNHAAINNHAETGVGHPQSNHGRFLDPPMTRQSQCVTGNGLDVSKQHQP